MNDKAREAFEAWYFDKFCVPISKLSNGTHAGGRYYSYLADDELFESFQAALQWAASQQAAEGWELPPLRYAAGVQAAIKAFACACALEDDADARVAAALRLESEIESYARSAFVAQQSEPWRKRKEPHEGALVGEQIPPCHFSQIARQTGESASIVNGLNNLEQAALDAYNEHFYKCSPSCSVATWTSAWRKGIDWFNNMPGGQSVTAVIAEKQAAEGWRPIDTAPKNEEILIYQPRFKRVTLSINDGFEYKEATHWMPLPLPPLAQGDSNGV
jgi:hypothetical protein